MQEVHENKIMKDFNNGSEKAFRWIYDEYFTLLRYYGLRYLDDVQEVDDIVQELYINIWKKKEDFKSLPSLRSYMLLSIRNRCLNKIRHEQVKNKNEYLVKNEEPEESILEKLVKLEVFDQLMSAFNKLPPAMRKVYWLSINGLSHQEISNKLNISINTIKTHKSRANVLLKKELKDLFLLLIGI
jgi:RNA polymerase sigma-70 factor (ECF subfamily)